jgi:riboflavin synthase
VQGHDDGTGTAAAVTEDGFSRRLRIELPEDLLGYVVERGSIAVEGVSLTVSALGDGWIEVSLIPETLERTSLGSVEPGDRLNVECDVLARYVRRMLPGVSGEGAPQAKPRGNPFNKGEGAPQSNPFDEKKEQ